MLWVFNKFQSFMVKVYKCHIIPSVLWIKLILGIFLDIGSQGLYGTTLTPAFDLEIRVIELCFQILCERI